MAEKKVLVLSSDGAVRGQVAAAVATAPGARAVFPTWDGLTDWRPTRSERVVVIDDEGHAEAAELISVLRARTRHARIIYLTARHSIGLEREVRRAGAAWYAVKPAPERDLERVIHALLAS
jgi:DNA-binding NarL/FixJ family response regulator